MSALHRNLAVFVLLTLLPAAILLWLGLRGSAPLVEELQRKARDEAAQCAQLAAGSLPMRLAALARDDAAAVAAAAAELGWRLPGEPPGKVLRQLEQRLEQHSGRLGAVALRLFAADGSVLLPRGPLDAALTYLPEWPRFRAWQRALDDGTVTATALRAQAQELQAPALRVRALALLLRAEPEQAAAALAGEPWPAFAAAGPLPCELLASSREGGAVLAAAARAGWLYAVPATEGARAGWLARAGVGSDELDRQRLRARAELGEPLLRTWAPVAGGTRLELLRDALPALAQGLPRAPGAGDDGCELGIRTADSAAPLQFLAPATVSLAVPTALGPIAVTARHRGLERLEQGARRRQLVTTAGIALLLLVMVAGTALARAALAHERRARALRDDFLANVSHELKTPLTSLRLHAEMLAGDELGPATRRRYGEVAQAEGARLSALVEDLLDFAALERGRRRIEPEPVDLGRAVREFAASWQPLAERDGVELRVEAAGEVPALCDPTALARILGNLLQNAFRHGRPPRRGAQPRIELRAGPGPAVEVADNGPGVPAADRERVFARFERAAHGRPGLGLGLALGRELAVACGGWLALRDDGERTVFRLELPPLPAPEASP